jgi:hypothetical protein
MPIIFRPTFTVQDEFGCVQPVTFINAATVQLYGMTAAAHLGLSDDDAEDLDDKFREVVGMLKVNAKYSKKYSSVDLSVKSFSISRPGEAGASDTSSTTTPTLTTTTTAAAVTDSNAWSGEQSPSFNQPLTSSHASCTPTLTTTTTFTTTTTNNTSS